MHRDLSSFSEQQLVEKLASGDQEVLESLFNDHYQGLCRYGLKYVPIPEAVEEIVQEIFINIWERRSVLDIKTGFKAYLYTAVRYKSFNYIKNQLPKDQNTVDEEVLENLPIIEPSTSDSRLADRLKRAIDELPPRCRLIFLLAKEEGLTYQEIAEELEVSVKTVDNQMGIALKKLRKSLSSRTDLQRLELILLPLIKIGFDSLGVSHTFLDS